MTNIRPYTFSNYELERQVLGCILSYPHAAGVVFSIIGPGAFYHENALAVELQKMHTEGRPIDIVTAFEVAKKAGINPGDLAEMTNIALSPANLEYHCRILFQYALSRKLATAAQNTINDIVTGVDVFDALESLKTALDIEMPGGNRNSYHVAELNTAEKLAEVMQNGYKSFVLPWHDEMNYPIEFEYTQLVLIAAGPSVGKTAFMLNVAFHLSQRGTPVGIFNFESSMDKLKQRMVSMFSGVSMHKIKKGELNANEHAAVLNAIESIDALPLYVNEKNRDIIGLEMAIREMHKKGVNLFFLDNMSNVDLPDGDRMDLRIGAYLKQITKLKKELGITICLLVHRARPNDKNRGAKINSLRNSGEYEQDADLIIFLDSMDTGEMEVDCAKNRDGNCWKVVLEFNKDIQQLKNRSFSIAEGVEQFVFNPSKRPDLFVGEIDF